MTSARRRGSTELHMSPVDYSTVLSRTVVHSGSLEAYRSYIALHQVSYKISLSWLSCKTTVGLQLTRALYYGSKRLYTLTDAG